MKAAEIKIEKANGSVQEPKGISVDADERPSGKPLGCSSSQACVEMRYLGISNRYTNP